MKHETIFCMEDSPQDACIPETATQARKKVSQSSFISLRG